MLTWFTYPSCFKTIYKGNLNIAGSGKWEKRRVRKAKQTSALHKGRADEKLVTHFRFSKQYFGITFFVVFFFYTVLRCHWRWKRRNIFQVVMKKTIILLSWYCNIPTSTWNGRNIFCYFSVHRNTKTNYCPLVTVHIFVLKCVIGLCMTSDNITLANFLFGPLRVDLTTF